MAKFAYNERGFLDTGYNKPIEVGDLRRLITGGTTPHQMRILREFYKQYIESGDSTKKDAADAIKARLPYFLPSGYCALGHSNKTILYNGWIQGDLDLKFVGGDIMARTIVAKVGEIMERGGLPYVVFCAVSPSGYGVKFLLATDQTDKDAHDQTAQAVLADLAAALDAAGVVLPDGAKWDKLTVSQPCTIPHDAGAIFGASVIPFNAPQFAPKPVRSVTPTQYSEADAGDLRAAHNYLVATKADIAAGVLEYRTTVGAYLSAFGETDGPALAHEVLEYSQTFGASNFRRNYSRQVATISAGVIPANWIIKQARAKGWEATRKATSSTSGHRTITASAGERFTDILRDNGLQLFGVRWIVPTGSGKTFAAARAASGGANVVLVVPTIALARNVASEYGAQLWDGENRKTADRARFYVSTYASFPALTERIIPSAWNVIFDEAHNFATSSARGFMWRDLRRAVACSRLYKTVTTLTGTDIETTIPEFLRLPKVEITKPRTIPKWAQIVRTNKVLKAAALGAVRAVAEGRKVVIALNNKGSGLAILDKHLGKVEGLRVQYFNSENKDGLEFLELCAGGKWPENCDVIVTTSVLKEGNNISDAGRYAVIFCGAFHACEVEQLTARFRNASNILAVILKGNEDAERAEKGAGWCSGKMRYAITQTAKEQATIINAATTCDFLRSVVAAGLENLGAAIGEKKPLICEGSDGYEPCPLLIDNAIYEQEKRAQYSSDARQQAALDAYGFKKFKAVVETIETTIEDEDMERNILGAAAMATKHEREKRQYEYVTELQNLTFFDSAKLHEALQRGATGGTKTAHDAIKAATIHTGDDSQSLAIVRAVAPKERDAVKRVMSVLSFGCIAANVGNISKDNKARVFVETMLSTFSDGELLTGAELKEKMLGIQKWAVSGKVDIGEGGEVVDISRADNAIKFARLMFVLEKTKQRREGKLVSVWRICYPNFLNNFLINWKDRVTPETLNAAMSALNAA